MPRSDPAPSPAGAAQSPAAAAAASERPKRAAGQGACTVVGSIVVRHQTTGTLARGAAVAFAALLLKKSVNHCVYGFHRI
jgi:hypothetical protein